MTVEVPAWAAEPVRALSYPLVFATVSGAHLYGFASADSDLDLRACHVLPAAEVVGCRPVPRPCRLRVLLTGGRLMRTGELETDLGVLGADLPYVPELLARKREAEHGPFPGELAEVLSRDVARLRGELAEARDASPLPDRPAPAAVAALHDLVVRTRLASGICGVGEAVLRGFGAACRTACKAS